MKTISVRAGGAAALGVLFLPVAYLARTNGGFKNGGGIPCAWREVTGYPCPACGLTRAFSSLSTFDFVGAFRFNAFVYLILAGTLLAVIAPQQLIAIKDRASATLTGRSPRSLTVIAIGVTAFIWVLNIARVSSGLYPN